LGIDSSMMKGTITTRASLTGRNIILEEPNNKFALRRDSKNSANTIENNTDGSPKRNANGPKIIVEKSSPSEKQIDIIVPLSKI
jgi:hypothetical protein